MFPVGRSSIFIILCVKVMTVHVTPSLSTHFVWLPLMLSGGPLKYEQSSFDTEVQVERLTDGRTRLCTLNTGA